MNWESKIKEMKEIKDFFRDPEAVSIVASSIKLYHNIFKKCEERGIDLNDEGCMNLAIAMQVFGAIDGGNYDDQTLVMVFSELEKTVGTDVLECVVEAFSEQ